jgi:beta-mannosidase
MDRARLTVTTAFDDQTSTFIIPSGAGFEVVFCPGARSTTILSTSRDEMLQLAQQGRVDKQATMMIKKSRSDVARRSAASATSQLDGTMLTYAMFVIAVVSTSYWW